MFRALLLLFTFCVPFAAFADCGNSPPVPAGAKIRIRYDRPLEKLAADVEALLSSQDFTALDRLAEEYGSLDALTTDGQPKLMGFYAGLVMRLRCADVRLPDDAWAAHRKLLSAWEMHSSKSLAPKLALAAHEHAFGWQARGGGYANTVSEEGWRLFRIRIENARLMLVKLEKAAVNDPEWYALMLKIGIAQGWPPEKFEAMFRRAIAKYPNYLAYYFTKSLYYSAKWGGSQTAFKGFVDEAVRDTKDKMGQAMYARLNWANMSSGMFQNGQTDWARMKQGFEDMLKSHNDMWNRNNYARFACMAGDTQTLRTQNKLVAGFFMPDAWGGMEKQCRQMAYEAERAEKAAGRT